MRIFVAYLLTNTLAVSHFYRAVRLLAHLEGKTCPNTKVTAVQQYISYTVFQSRSSPADDAARWGYGPV